MVYRPPQWQNPSPARVMITFPGQSQNAPFSSATGIGVTLPNTQTQYVFDAVISSGHEQELRTTDHPVQTGASISDHAYVMPSRLILDIGMSDVMDAYFSPSTWVGASSKSVSAYQTMLQLSFARIPLTVTTRLRTYTNMLLRALRAEDTYRTTAGLRARVEFYEIFMATILLVPNSARNQDTGDTNLGSVTTQPPTSAQESQNGIAGLTGVPAVPSTALGAGQFSSVNVNNLSNLPGK